DIKIVLEYGMLSEAKFFEKAGDFFLYPTVNQTYFTLQELKDKITETQTDKEGNLIVLYASNADAQHTYIAEAQGKGYEVLLLDSPIVAHLIQKLESENDKLKFVRVDADHVDNLIKKGEEAVSVLNEDEKKQLQESLEEVISKQTYTIQFQPMSADASPFMITRPEFMRRMKEMSAHGGGGMFGMGNLPDMFNLVVNTNHPLVHNLLHSTDKEKQNQQIKQALDIAKLSQNLLKGEELTAFVKRSFEMMN
ncbi:MAG TPA: molecular chaperone HtpG, partial [Chitinophagaceae bacterium]|nr:molecular chaperone HtpG [Chitinophagaceae bacterium]